MFISRLNIKWAAVMGTAVGLTLIILGVRGCSIARERASVQDESESETATVCIYDDEACTTYSLPLEEYVLRVTAAEMPASFSLEALKAQAVAARTYTVRKMADPCGKGGADVCTLSSCCQAYKSEAELYDIWGENAEMYFEKLRSAAKSTQGLILTYDGEPIEALFHSSSGGMTENASDVFGGDAPYLKSVSSPNEEGSAHYKSTVSFTRKQFASIVNAAISGAELDESRLESQLEILERSESGRVKAMRVGSATITGRELRSALGLNSTAFTIELSEGRVKLTTLGYGHGVGMSQYGADAMAQMGADYEEILLHYYSGAKIESIDLNKIK